MIKSYQNGTHETGEYWIGWSRSRIGLPAWATKHRMRFIRIDRGGKQIGSVRFVSWAAQQYHATHGSSGHSCSTWPEAKRFALTGESS